MVHSIMAFAVKSDQAYLEDPMVGGENHPLTYVLLMP